ncbi:uncharacterized protein TRIVIDRAFT_217700 [Trichoderma virens Gv29-8]|uniref:Uncharacterized protein n=1 Tax=Hypocrea virens (strain Gv29-8 / FGSC 10586) TaxID=413071 RepID=G9MFD7_HYPVG|nr:uncharacterized protein TRIVIDRAFT_217700 [Trichoderma virens Gv29-8]EHK27103.1 hypothetical protein TRIVIDRAFT_217700 [Trichoderma virens Gv29-8]
MSIKCEQAQYGISPQWRDKDMGSDLDFYAVNLKERLDKLVAYKWKDSLRQAADEFERELGASG